MPTSGLGTNEDSTDYVKLGVKVGEVIQKHTEEKSSGQISALSHTQTFSLILIKLIL